MGISSNLRLKGYQVEIANSGRAAIQRCSEQPYDLIIVDVFMPDIDGLGVIKDLRKKKPSPKIIAMTGHSDWPGGDIEHLVKRMGSDRFISKPIDIKDLCDLIESLEEKAE